MNSLTCCSTRSDHVRHFLNESCDHENCIPNADKIAYLACGHIFCDPCYGSSLPEEAKPLILTDYIAALRCMTCQESKSAVFISPELRKTLQSILDEHKEEKEVNLEAIFSDSRLQEYDAKLVAFIKETFESIPVRHVVTRPSICDHLALALLVAAAVAAPFLMTGSGRDQ